jgi:hypothetical protein
MVLMGPSPPGGVPPSLVKRIRIPTHTSHDAGGAIWPGKVSLLGHLVSEAVGTNGLGEKLWRARGVSPDLLGGSRLRFIMDAAKKQYGQGST